MRCGAAVSASRHTGQSEAIHSPEAWARTVVRFTVPVEASIAVVCTIAICCWPSALRTISSPLESGAYRKVRAPSPGRSDPIVATSDFSGFESSDCALASAAASAAIDSLDRCIGGLPVQNVETHSAGSRAARAYTVADRLLGVLGHQGLQLALGALMLIVGFACLAKDASELRPAVGGTHVDDADRLDPGPWRVDPEEPRRLAALNEPPELLLGGQQEVLIERVCGNWNLDPFAASGDDREHGGLGIRDPHIVLNLGHVLLGRALLRERPGQHEFGLEHGSSAFDDPIEGCCNPAQQGMPDAVLDLRDSVAGI